MLRFHHVNLAVPTGQLDAEAEFLTDVLGLARVDPGEELTARGARWFGLLDGAQVHLSDDPEFTPSARAHVAVELGDELELIELRLRHAGLSTEPAGSGPVAIVFCTDPAGNRWELRGSRASDGDS